MAVTDPVSDMLTRIRNATMMNHSDVSIPSSKLKVEIARILSEHGYIDRYEVSNEGTIKINLSYKTDRESTIAVSYTHLTLPTKRVV